MNSRMLVFFYLLLAAAALGVAGCCDVYNPLQQCCAMHGFAEVAISDERLRMIQRTALADGGLVRDTNLCTSVSGQFATDCQIVPYFCRTRSDPNFCIGTAPRSWVEPHLLRFSPVPCQFH